MTATRGGSRISAAVLACETLSERLRIKDAQEAAEKEAATEQARRDGRSWSRFLHARRTRTPYIPSGFPVEYGRRSYSPASKYADGIRAGDYVTFFDPAQATEHHRDPCKPSYDYMYTQTILRRALPPGVNVGHVVATFQHFGRDGAPVQIALHTGVVLDKRSSDKLWIEENSGRGCDFDGDCSAGRALVDLVSMLMEQDTGCHYRRPAIDFARRLVVIGHDDEAAKLAWDTADRWGLMSNGRISGAGRTWWYAEQRHQGVEVLEDAMPAEQPTSRQVINISRSTVNGSSFATGPHAQATVALTAPGEVSDVIAKVVEMVQAGRENLNLSDEQSRELDDSLEVLQETAASPESRGAGFRVAVRSVLNLAGALAIGASGNAVWEAFKALAS